MIDKLSGYFLLDRDFLLADNSMLDFDIYYSISVKNEVVPVLLVAQNSLVSNLKEKISQKSYGQLYVKEYSKSHFEKYLENSLPAIISNPVIPIEKKAKYMSKCATGVLKQVFSSPRSGANIKRLKKTTQCIVDLAMCDLKAIPHLLSLSSHHYYTFSHCLQVATFALGLWVSIHKGGAVDDMHSFTLGCMLHDIGKTKISEAILNKPSKLDKDEFEEIKKHPEYGVELLSEFLPEISLDVILHHHERHDGSGYPEGLEKNNISDNAKIAAIADVYDALTTNRAYAPADDPFNALVKMKKEMVGHFEQEKFENFIKFLGTFH